MAVDIEALHKRLIIDWEASGVNIAGLELLLLANEVRARLKEIIGNEADEQIINRLLWRLRGLGPLEPLLRDQAITEILVNGPNDIYVEQNGKLQKSEQVFSSLDELKSIIFRVAGLAGRRIDESQPFVDARLADGSRVNAIIPPLVRPYPILTIRKFPSQVLMASDLVNKNTLSLAMKKFLEYAILAKQNIIISGSTGSGKTSLLNALASLIPAEERVIVIEDTAEIKLNLPHLVTLEARQPNIEGKGEVSIRVLLKNTLRMRPDRIIIGEVRGGEALDMLQAMNTGHQGSLTTIHANAPLEAMLRLETMALMTDLELPLSAIRAQANMAINYIVQIERLPTGERKVVNISELSKPSGTDFYSVRSLFIYNKREKQFQATGIRSENLKIFEERGVKIDSAIFA